MSMTGGAEQRAARWCSSDQRLFARWLSLRGALHNAEREVARARQHEDRCAAERPDLAMVPPDQQNPMNDSLSAGGYVVVRSDTATLDPSMAAVALFAISVASVSVAALLAWHHGADPLDRDFHRARQVRRRWERQVERIRKRLSQAESRRCAVREVARQEVMALEAAMLSTFHRYARFNQLHRDGRDLPPSLRDDQFPRLPMPAVLDEPLDWALHETAVREDR